MDGLVFYAREDLNLGSGFGTAIEARGGAPVKEALQRIGRLGMGEAVVTPAGNLKSRHIIHACGPKFQEPDIEPKLRKCVQAALDAANSAGMKTVAFPPMGAGFYGVPLDLCVRVMLEVIKQTLTKPGTVECVTICVLDDREFKAFQSKLQAN